MNQAKRLVWIDLEMTGLDVNKERIIEMAAIVTDEQLNPLAQSEVLVVKQSDALLQAMDEWNQKTHGGTGLIERVRNASLSEEAAEQAMLDFLSEHVEAGASPMCGNSIGQDRRFLQVYMPRLEAFFHYRNIDVSTLKELSQRWAPQTPSFVKKNTHRALDDIQESIAELVYLRNSVMKI